jgi:hypothetical protein
MTGWEWTPDTFSAIGTVGTLCATAWVLVRQSMARVGKQAEHVVVWIDRMNSSEPPIRDIGLFIHITQSFDQSDFQSCCHLRKRFDRKFIRAPGNGTKKEDSPRLRQQCDWDS